MTQDLLTPLWSATDAPVLQPWQWELLLAQARAARLGARLAGHVEARGWRSAVPDEVWPHLLSARLYSEMLQRDVRSETDHLVRALAPLGVPVVLLKGAAYVAAGLPPARGRLFSDIDILVPQGRLRDVESALFAGGWMPERLSPYDDRYYRQWMHELPPLQHVQRHSFLDVHHTIAPPTSRFVIDGAQLLDAALPLASQPGVRVLAPADMVLHSAVHLMQEGEFSAGLRDLLDLNDLLQHFSRDPAFWPALAARARQLGLVRPLLHVLLQLHSRLGAVLPAELVQGLRADAGPGVAATQRLLDAALLPHHRSCENMGVRAARWLLYVRSHWLRMPWYQIAPHLVHKAWSRTRERIQAAPATKVTQPRQ